MVVCRFYTARGLYILAVARWNSWIVRWFWVQEGGGKEIRVASLKGLEPLVGWNLVERGRNADKQHTLILQLVRVIGSAGWVLHRATLHGVVALEALASRRFQMKHVSCPFQTVTTC